MSTSKDLSSLVDSLQAKAAANPAKAAIYQAKLDSKIASIIAKGKTVVIDGATVTAYDLDAGSSGGSSGGGSTTGSTIALSARTDSKTGTTGNDTFDGSREITVAGVLDSLNNADSLDGAGGTDTLIVQLGTAAGGVTTTPASLRNIEVVSVENSGGANNVLSLQNADTSLTTIKSSNNAAATQITNITAAVGNFEVSTTASNFTATVVGTLLSGSSDSTTLTLNSVTAGTILIGTTAASTGYETINVVSAGSVKNGNTTDLVLDDGNGTGLTTVNFSGGTALDVDFTPTTITTVNAAAMTAALDVQFAAANAQNVSVTGGSGNDVIDVQGFAATDTINGGAGTDRLVLTNAEAIAATTVRSNVSNIEVISLSDTTNGTGITVSNFGATGLQLGAAVDHTGAIVATFAAGTNSFDRQASTDNGNEATTLTVSGVATTDVMNVTLGTTTAGSTYNGTGAFTITGAETVNIVSRGGANTIGGALTITNTAAAENIVVTGDQTLTITGALTADSLNASGMSGNAGLVMAGGSGTQSITLTGTNNADTLIGGTAADIITGGAGADTIRNAVSGANSAANDILTGGAGFDSFQLVGASASAANYTGSAFISDFTVGTSATTTDILVIDITEATYTAGTNLEQGGGDLAATAAGAATTLIQNVAQNAAATAIVAGADVIKLTTGVAFTTDLQTTYAAAIGTATVTGITTAGAELIGMFYDTTNARAVVFLVDAGAGNQIISSADTVTLIGTISMTATDYASFNSNNIAFVDF